MDERLNMLVFAPIKVGIRVISFRKANKREIPRYNRTQTANPEMIDKVSPEWTQATFKRARPAHEVLPEIFPPKLAATMLKRKRGRPVGSVKAAPKVALNLRVDPDVLAVLRATGPGWQTRVNTIFRERFAL
ncbi:MAG: BrnA antitoxin family protein [Xanthomonadales bacterium]|nr:BrnA antitoxin family protein [Xanthomonadales bacterium]